MIVAKQGPQYRVVGAGRGMEYVVIEIWAKEENINRSFIKSI